MFRRFFLLSDRQYLAWVDSVLLPWQHTGANRGREKSPRGRENTWNPKLEVVEWGRGWCRKPWLMCSLAFGCRAPAPADRGVTCDSPRRDAHCQLSNRATSRVFTEQAFIRGATNHFKMFAFNSAVSSHRFFTSYPNYLTIDNKYCLILMPCSRGPEKRFKDTGLSSVFCICNLCDST